MSKFAHMADIHLGAQRDPTMQRLEMECLQRAMQKCIEIGVDFVLISGDLFHMGLPDLAVVNEAARELMKVRDAGIPIYAIYGSHDYSPTVTSIIDLLETTRTLVKISKYESKKGKLRLRVFEDKETGAKLTGISARRIGLESKYYEKLDREALENEDGFKIFAFHSGLSEFRPPHLREMDTVPISNFPKGFSYYAGGHIHDKGQFELPGYKNVAFPGALFTGHRGRDLEATAKGEGRGFYVVTFDEEVEDIEFIEVGGFDGVFFEYDATGKNSTQAEKELQDRVEGLEVDDKVVVLKVFGELSGGKTSDVNIPGIKANLLDRGALYVYTNRHGLTSREFTAIRVAGEDTQSIERKLLRENIGAVEVETTALKGEKGAALATELLKVLRQDVKTNESKKDYQERMAVSALKTLGLEDMLEVGTS